jgi:exodeoxyribonuclease III
MRLATWNVNSIRARVDRVTDWLVRDDIDVLAMQETKCSAEQFPTLPFEAIGYEVVHCGFSQWNGVAIASRIGIDDVAVGFEGQPTWSSEDVRRAGAERPGVVAVEAAAEARAIGATCGGVRVWSLYIPNGRSVGSDHYRYKLEWLAALGKTAAGWLASDAGAPIALVGDWNIAPTDDDVWDVKVFEHSTHVTAPERAAFRAIESRYADVVRPFTPGPGVFTYWDYTQLRFPRREGMRIDFVLGSPALAARVRHAEIARNERKPGKKGTPAPSDHAPVWVDLAD